MTRAESAAGQFLILILILILIGIGGCRGAYRSGQLNLRLTVTDMETVQDGLRMFAEEHGGSYPTSLHMRPAVVLTVTSAYAAAQPISLIAPLLEQYYAPHRVPTTDVWGHELLYAVTADRKHYALIAVDADGKPQPVGSRPAWPMGDAWRDIVVIDGQFVSYPYGISVSRSGS